MSGPEESGGTTPRPGEEDRRQQARHVTTFRACRVESGGRVHIGIVRNISPGGAQIETKLNLSMGETLSYCWEGIEPIEADVVWREGDRVGVKNRVPVDGWETSHPPRAVRIPADLSCRVWEGDIIHRGRVANISQTGMRCEGEFDIAAGTQVTVEVGPLVLPNTTVRWCADGAAGLRFGTPIRMEMLITLLSDQTKPESPQTGKLAS
ncbi:MAG: PilZ domain-containing protein [Novosphingobium sp.]|uniref:PilZ domain-containing protein n=1 Tax=Tsuneonella sp. CC-YZS046 TaxID=3042152 RepID=UPI002D76F311|nr:PilZ domain-containing protein [Tsuneonella sp. CC-YZS046]WRO68071.1 PilZ domain-containing protein [Tsuneonella sp. CC-YZS046]